MKTQPICFHVWRKGEEKTKITTGWSHVGRGEREGNIKKTKVLPRMETEGGKCPSKSRERLFDGAETCWADRDQNRSGEASWCGDEGERETREQKGTGAKLCVEARAWGFKTLVGHGDGEKGAWCKRSAFQTDGVGRCCGKKKVISDYGGLASVFLECF